MKIVFAFVFIITTQSFIVSQTWVENDLTRRLKGEMVLGFGHSNDSTLWFNTYKGLVKYENGNICRYKLNSNSEGDLSRYRYDDSVRNQEVEYIFDIYVRNDVVCLYSNIESTLLKIENDKIINYKLKNTEDLIFGIDIDHYHNIWANIAEHNSHIFSSLYCFTLNGGEKFLIPAPFDTLLIDCFYVYKNFKYFLSYSEDTQKNRIINLFIVDEYKDVRDTKLKSKNQHAYVIKFMNDSEYVYFMTSDAIIYKIKGNEIIEEIALPFKSVSGCYDYTIFKNEVYFSSNDNIRNILKYDIQTRKRSNIVFPDELDKFSIVFVKQVLFNEQILGIYSFCTNVNFPGIKILNLLEEK